MEADFRKGDKEITLDELIRLIKNHEYSKFIVEGLGETTIENVLFEQVVAEYESNKHYIELGKAVEYAVQNEIRFIRPLKSCEKLIFIDSYDKGKLIKEIIEQGGPFNE